MSDDIDKQLSLLEGKTTFASFGSKVIFIKISIAILLGLALAYFTKSMYVFNIEYNAKDKSIAYSINVKNYLIASIILSVVSYFGIDQLPFF